MVTITQLKVQNRDKDRVSVYLDGEYAFSVSLLTAAGLRLNLEISEAEIAELRREGEAHLAYQQAVRFLGYRPRSADEVSQYLSKKGYPDELTANVLERLDQQGYVDDGEFARFWVENREQFRPRGRRALTYELRRKGVSHEDIEAAIEQVDEEGAAWSALSGRAERWTQLDKRQFIQKALGHLNRRGFPYAVSMAAAERAWRELQESDGGS